MKLIANLILGSREEPFLPFSLQSIYKVVDFLVVNYNGDKKNSYNYKKLLESNLYKDKRVKIIESDFIDFSYCRNLILDYTKEQFGFEDVWILYIDADEVHYQNFNYIRDIIKLLPQQYFVIDTYFYQFIFSFNYFFSIERRHNILFKLTKDIKWEGKVHEKPVNIKGKRLAIPYIYFHYGYLLSKQALLNKLIEYRQMENKFEEIESLRKDPDQIFHWYAPYMMNFKNSHPLFMKDFIKQNHNKEDYIFFENLIKQYSNNIKNRILKKLNYLNFYLRPLYRYYSIILSNNFLKEFKSYIKKIKNF